MQNLTDPRPTFLDRLRAAISAFKDPNGTFTRGLLAGVRAYPFVGAGVTNAH